MYYGYAQFLQDCKTLKHKIEASQFFPEALLCIARGGMALSQMLALAWNIRDVYSINAVSYTPNKTQHDLVLSHLPQINHQTKKILVVDDIVDSGTSLEAVLMRMQHEYPQMNFKSACLFQKMSASLHADFYVHTTEEWIDFFWEVDVLRLESTLQ